MGVSVHLTDWVRLTADNPTALSQEGSELCGDLVTFIFSTALELSRHHELPPVYKQILQHCPRSIGTEKAEAFRPLPRLITLDSGKDNAVPRDSSGSQQTQSASQHPIQFLHPRQLCPPSFQAVTYVAGRFFHVVNSTFMLLKNNPSMPDEDVLVKLII